MKSAISIELSAGSKILVYTDDVLLYKPDSDGRYLQKDVDLISKTMVLSRVQSRNYIPCPITLDGSALEQVKKYKYLGGWISDDLTWTAHIESIACKSR